MPNPAFQRTRAHDTERQSLGGIEVFAVKTKTTIRKKEKPRRMLLNVRFPHQPFNATAKDGTAGSKLNRILEATKPEAVYFTGQNGQRRAVLIVDLPDSSRIPALVDRGF